MVERVQANLLRKSMKQRPFFQRFIKVGIVTLKYKVIGVNNKMLNHITVLFLSLKRILDFLHFQ